MSMVPRRREFAVTTLGSGGPFSRVDRVSAGYCIWMAGRPSLLLDAGGGTFARIGQAEIPVAQIDTFAISHTHIDHTGDLSPIIFASVMAGRTEPYAFAGPCGSEKHPGATRFFDLLFGKDGAWSYLHGFSNFAYRVHEVPSSPLSDGEPHVIHLATPGARLCAMPVRHGGMPTVAYRVEYGGRSIVYSGDVSEESEALVKLARGCDLLIHDFAVPERHVAYSAMHVPPSTVGRIAARAECKRLMMSHIMPAIEDELSAAVAAVRKEYDGEIIEARDLFTLEL